MICVIFEQVKVKLHGNCGSPGLYVTTSLYRSLYFVRLIFCTSYDKVKFLSLQYED